MRGRGVLATNWGAHWRWFCHCTWTISCLCLHRALSSSRGRLDGAAHQTPCMPWPTAWDPPGSPYLMSLSSKSLCLGPAAVSPRTPFLKYLFSTPERHPNPCVKAEMKNWLAHVSTVEGGDFCACRLTVSLLLAWQVSACCNPGTNQCHGCELASSFITLSSSFPSLLRKKSYLWTWTRWPPYGRFCHSPWGLELGTCSSGKAERHSSSGHTQMCAAFKAAENLYVVFCFVFLNKETVKK